MHLILDRCALREFIFVSLAALTLLGPTVVDGSSECLEYDKYLHADRFDLALGDYFDVCIQGDYAYFVSSPFGLVTYDISDRSSPVKLNAQKLPYGSDGLLVDDHRLFVVAGASGIVIFDLKDPAIPAAVDTVDTPGVASAVFQKDQILYIADGWAGLQLARILDDSSLELLGACSTPGWACSIDVVGGIAYVADLAGGLHMIDISSPEAPDLLSSLSFDFEIVSLAHHDSVLFIQSGNSYRMSACDISNPTNPEIIWEQSVSGWGRGLIVDGDNLFCLTHHGFYVFSLLDSAQPVRIGFISCYTGNGMALGDGKVLVAGLWNEFWLVETSNPYSPPLFGSANASPESVSYINGMTVSGQYLFLARVRNAVQIFDISDPLQVEHICTWPIPGYCFRVSLDGNIAYVAAGGNGVQICDMSDIENPEIIANIPTSDNVFDVCITPGLAHIAVLDQGYWIADISDPSNPRILSKTSLGGRSYRIAAREGFAFISCKSSGLKIVDYRDPSQPKVVPTSLPGGGEDLSLHGNTLFVTGGIGRGVYAVDVSNPEAPLVADSFGEGMRIQGLYAHDEVLYAKDEFQGVVILDVSDVFDMKLIGMAPSRWMTSWGNGGDIAGDGKVVYSTSLVNNPNTIDIWNLQCGAGRRSIEIDVKPHNDNNPINCSGRGRGIIPVAVLTTPDFDATTVDHTTIRFGPNEASEAHANRHGILRHEKDVDGDGDLDLLFHFRLAETGIQCGDSKVTLTGETFEGREFIGADKIRAVSNWDKSEVVTTGIRITPNPFNPQTTISFTTEEPQRVRLAVYDIRGRLLVELANQQYEVGEHSVKWQGRDSAGRALPSGEYFFRVEMGDRVETRKAMLVR